MEATQQVTPPTLKLQKGGIQTQTARCIHATWLLAHAALWPTRTFSEEEKKEFLTLIASYYRGRINKVQCFEQIAQRILLAKRFVLRGRGRWIAKPSDWLNIHYVNGIAGTKQWYTEMVEQRKKVPHYNEGLKIFAESIWNFYVNPTSAEYQKLRDKLSEKKQYDLIAILNQVAALKVFSN
jgi:hypothetical protein